MSNDAQSNGAPDPEPKTVPMGVDPSLIRRAFEFYSIENVAVADDGKIAPTMIETMTAEQIERDIENLRIDDKGGVAIITDLDLFAKMMADLFGKVLSDYAMDTMVLPSNAARIRQVRGQLNDELTHLRPVLDHNYKDSIEHIEEMMESLDSVARNLGNDG